MKDFQIIHPGLYTTIQDLGRRNYQNIGVSCGGPMDEKNFKIANYLVGNTFDCACLEITAIGPKIEFYSNQIISITGGDLSPCINGHSINMYETIYIHSGDILTFGKCTNGFRSYIAFSGGIDSEIILESRSFVDGKTVKKGDAFTTFFNGKYFKKKTIKNDYTSSNSGMFSVRVVLGPEDDYFTYDNIQLFFNSIYSISNQSNRMGIRLDGSSIEHRKSADIISNGIAKGAIQIPGSGVPIIMMADRQTIGGYTKIGYVISDDIDMLAQLKPGSRIRFKKVSLDNAHKLYKNREMFFNQLLNDPVEYQSHKQYQVRFNSNQYNVSVLFNE